MKLTDAQKQWQEEMRIKVAREKRAAKRIEARSRIEDIKLARELGLPLEEVIAL